jgi:serpin B
VSDVLHQAFLLVDEEGSEGAAATALFMSRMLFIPRLRVTANRTFFLSIVHKKSRVLVFAGKVDRPDTVTAD